MLEQMLEKVVDTVSPKDDNLQAQINEWMFRNVYNEFVTLTNGRHLGNRTESQMEKVLSGKQKITNLVNKFKP